MDVEQPLKGSVDRLLAYAQIGVTGSLFLLDRSHAGTDCQPPVCHGENHSQFVITQRQDVVIPFDDVRCIQQWICLVEHGVGNCYCQACHRIGVGHVPEIDQSGYLLMIDDGVLNKDIVVIGIIVDDTLLEVRQARHNAFGKICPHCVNLMAQLRIFDLIHITVDYCRSVAQIPRKIPTM